MYLKFTNFKNEQIIVNMNNVNEIIDDGFSGCKLKMIGSHDKEFIYIKDKFEDIKNYLL